MTPAPEYVCSSIAVLEAREEETYSLNTLLMATTDYTAAPTETEESAFTE